MVTHALMEVQMVKRVAMIFGVVFILVGLLGFTVSGGMAMGEAAPIRVFREDFEASRDAVAGPRA